MQLNKLFFFCFALSFRSCRNFLLEKSFFVIFSNAENETLENSWSWCEGCDNRPTNYRRAFESRHKLCFQVNPLIWINNFRETWEDIEILQGHSQGTSAMFKISYRSLGNLSFKITSFIDLKIKFKKIGLQEFEVTLNAPEIFSSHPQLLKIKCA